MRVSVITISLNPGGSLQRTIDSVLAQDHPDVEWIVIDGGSRDGSLDLYRLAGERIAKLVSEPDRGIADAMNKGWRLATGDAVLYLNAGDVLHAPGSLSLLAAAADGSGWVVGSCDVHAEDGRFLYGRSVAGSDAHALLAHGCRIFHASVLLARRHLVELDGFDPAFRSSMDYDLWLRLRARGLEPRLVVEPVSRFFLGGTSANLIRRDREDRLSRRRNGQLNPAPVELTLACIARVKHLLRFLRGSRLAYRLKEALGR